MESNVVGILLEKVELRADTLETGVSRDDLLDRLRNHMFMLHYSLKALTIICRRFRTPCCVCPLRVFCDWGHAGGFRDVIIAKRGLEIVLEMMRENFLSTTSGVGKWCCHFLFFACCSASSSRIRAPSLDYYSVFCSAPCRMCGLDIIIRSQIIRRRDMHLCDQATVDSLPRKGLKVRGKVPESAELGIFVRRPCCGSRRKYVYCWTSYLTEYRTGHRSAVFIPILANHVLVALEFAQEPLVIESVCYFVASICDADGVSCSSVGRPLSLTSGCVIRSGRVAVPNGLASAHAQFAGALQLARRATD